MNTISLTLPMPPSTNRIWRTSGQRVYRSAEYVQFLNDVGMTCNIARLPAPTAAPVELRMKFYMARTNGDVTNRIKALEDALKGFCYVDDLQVVRGSFERLMDAKRPRVEVEVREVTS